MDWLIRILLAVAAVLLMFRLQSIYRRTRGRVDKGEVIRKKLEELRKKRDDD
ncbi:hypothetical protein [Paenibacillus hexagrammi]|uniref:DUF4083 domain-containing protein n=1 Tax=Paenibacillus hexagrammi TaxID=2908839 RepID=A0ABY3SE84_9BACL|nr:hypothetical protein [Paenibacillus sp. YPD9-1]UJF32298.1 hypothetical protein L0M14_21660 [Paenibacillus sp. YPD9-1]